MATHVVVDTSVLPANAAQETGGNLALAATKLTAILTALQGILTSQLEVNNAVVSTSNPVPITSGQVGLIAPKTGAGGNAANTTGGQEYQFKWAGDVTVQRYKISNETGADVRYCADATASANSIRVKDGNTVMIAEPCTVLHIYTAANQNINQAGGIIIEGRN